MGLDPGDRSKYKVIEPPTKVRRFLPIDLDRVLKLFARLGVKYRLHFPNPGRALAKTASANRPSTLPDRRSSARFFTPPAQACFSTVSGASNDAAIFAQRFSSYFGGNAWAAVKIGAAVIIAAGREPAAVITPVCDGIAATAGYPAAGNGPPGLATRKNPC